MQLCQTSSLYNGTTYILYHSTIVVFKLLSTLLSLTNCVLLQYNTLKNKYTHSAYTNTFSSSYQSSETKTKTISIVPLSPYSTFLISTSHLFFSIYADTNTLISQSLSKYSSLSCRQFLHITGSNSKSTLLMLPSREREIVKGQSNLFKGIKPKGLRILLFHFVAKATIIPRPAS